MGEKATQKIIIDRISDPELKAFVIELINSNEELSQIVKAQQIQIQELKDEINRLKGEQGKPGIKGNKKKRLKKTIYHQKRNGKSQSNGQNTPRRQILK